MGPRPIGRGMLYSAVSGVNVKRASMGPRPIGRGMDTWDGRGSWLTTQLQWGRGRSAAECARP